MCRPLMAEVCKCSSWHSIFVVFVLISCTFVWVSALYSIRDWPLVPETSENVMFAIRRGRLCLLCRFPRDTAVFATGFGGAQQCNLFEAPSMNGLCWSMHLPVSLACRTCAYFPEHILWRCKTQKQLIALKKLFKDGNSLEWLLFLWSSPLVENACVIPCQ